MSNSVISGHDDLKKAYQDDKVAREYIERRFTSALGGLLHDRQAGVVRDLVRQHAIKRAAEIAPGPARVTSDVLPLLESVTLLDASGQMLGEARRRLTDLGLAPRARFVQADAFQLPVNRLFDLVYSFRLIRHFERADRLRLYEQIAGILKPGGWLVFDAVNVVVSSVLRAKAAPGEYAHFDALLTPDEIRDEIRVAGFEVSALVAVQHRFPLMQQCQVRVGPRSQPLARFFMELIDRSGGEPLEWIVVCRRG